MFLLTNYENRATELRCQCQLNTDRFQRRFWPRELDVWIFKERADTHTHTRTKKNRLNQSKLVVYPTLWRISDQGVIENDLACPTTANSNHWYVNRFFSSAFGVYRRVPLSDTPHKSTYLQQFTVSRAPGKAAPKQRSVAQFWKLSCIMGWFQNQQRTCSLNWWQFSWSLDDGWLEKVI